MIFGTWNIQGWRTKDKEVIKELIKYNADVAVLTETKKKGRGSEELENFIHLYSGVNKEHRARAGVSILVNKKLRNFVRSWEQINERIIRLNMAWKGYELTIIGIYAPTDDSLVEVKDEFYETLTGLIERVGRRSEIILLGDLNARTGSGINDAVVGSFGEEVTNDSGERLIEMCREHRLKIMNGFYKHKNIHKYTWCQHTRQLKSIIDYVICRQNTKMYIEDVKVQRGAECGSDHYMLRAKIYFPFRHVQRTQNQNQESDDQQTRKVNQQRYAVHGLQDDSTTFLYKLRLSKKLSEVVYSDAIKMYNEIVSKIHEAASEAVGQTKRGIGYPAWWTKQIQSAVQEKKELYQRWLSTKDTEDRKRYERANREVKKLTAKGKNDMWDRTCGQIENYIGSTKSREAWKVVKSLRANTRESARLDGIEMKEWIQYYEELLTENRPEFQMNIETREEEEFMKEDQEITPAQVKNAVKSMKNGKAPGPGGVQIELIKHGPEVLFELLAYVFNLFLGGEEVPGEWTTAYMSNIYKKGDRKKCSNYRGISVTNSIARIYGKIIKERIEKEFHDVDEQSGFRAGRSCVDSIYTLKQAIQKRLAYSMETHLVFIDLTKAYDSIPLMKLWKAMRRQGISSIYVRAVQKLYNNMTCCVKVGSKLSNDFRISKGLKQGCCIAPTLFKIYLKEALENWRKNATIWGYQ